jgi:non-ribosomal peptide synthetase component F
MSIIDWKRLQAGLTDHERLRLEQLLLTEGERFNIFPLSSAQERRWSSVQYAPGRPMHHIAVALRIEGHIRPDTLVRSFNALIERHEILRTTFHQLRSQPMQAIAPIGSVHITLPVVDLQRIASNVQEREIARLAVAEREKSFELDQGPLLRIMLVVLAPTLSILLLTIHHLVFDGWSMHILMRDLTAFYTAIEARQEAELPSLLIQYADFAVWERHFVHAMTKQPTFLAWQQRLSSADPLLDLPLKKNIPPPLRTFRSSTRPVVLSADHAGRLKQLAQSERATIFIVLLAAFQTLLYRYTGQRAFVIGTYAANRQRPELAHLIGDCTNILPLLADLAEQEPTFRAFLRHTRDLVLEAQDYADIPLSRLTDGIWPHVDRRQHVLFPVMFVLLNKRVEAEIPGLRLAPVEIEETETFMPFDLQLCLWIDNTDITGYIEYNTDIFAEDTIAHLIRHFYILIENIAADPDRQLSVLPLFTEQEFNQRYHLPGRSELLPIEYSTVLHRIAMVAQARPEALAVCDAHGSLTFQQVEQRASRLASALRIRGIGAGQGVVLKVERTVELVVGLLGVLKAGAACMLCEPESSRQDIPAQQEYSLLLTRQQIAAWISADDSRLSQRHPIAEIQEQQLACVIPARPSQDDEFQLSHRALVAVLDVYRKHCAVDSSDRCLHCASLDLPIALIEILLPLFSGATLYLAPHMNSNPLELINKLQISVAALPAPLLVERSCVQQTTLRGLIVTGDLRPIDSLVRERFADALVYAIGRHGKSFWPLPACLHWSSRVTFRASGATFQAFVLNDRMAPVPEGVVGTLYLAGDGVPESSKNSVPQSPSNYSAHLWSSPSRAKAYCTELRARALAGDKIEYIGSSETMVIHNGRRIWLNELAQILREVSEICDAVLVTTPADTGEQQFIAYVRLHAGAPRAQVISNLKQHVLRSLPAILRPAAIVVVPAFPLTVEGLIHYDALPTPQANEKINYFILEQKRDQISNVKQKILEKWLSGEKKHGK